MRSIAICLLLLWGCAPTPPANQCSADSDCADGHQCVVGVCVPIADAGPGCQPEAERCDGRDNDCDETVDEGLELGAACQIGVGLCERHGALVCGPDGGTICSAAAGAPMAEVCNGLDDNCDGEIDNLPEQACPLNGCAQPGKLACVSGLATCVVAAEVPELCDGQADDDCDGQVDEGCDCQGNETRPCEGETRGLCEAGTQRCDDGQWTGCVGAILPSEERCNELDDDCDGQVDEGFELGSACTAGLGACATRGTLRCDAGQARCGADPGEPVPERCNDVDDDCDGTVDEGVRNVCGNCGPVPAEICNGLDDNCNGTVDEGCGCGVADTQDCFVGLPAPCVAGVQACQNGEWGACSGVGPTVEECNGLDDNCNGEVDEGLLNACGNCGPLPVEVCNQRDDDCDGNTDEGVTNACGGCGAPPTELCNGHDDDCDGQVDEGLLNACGECGPLGIDICDGTDNDCDGRFDENHQPLPCTEGVGACMDSGVVACVAGVPGCDATPGRAEDEVCNDIDDDCDGSIDEAGCDCADSDATCDGQDDDCDGSVDENYVVVECEAGVGACQANGRLRCLGGELMCDAPTGDPVDEFCDGADNDCDGRSDEGLDEGFADCFDGEGVCRRNGQVLCIEGRESCDVEAGAPQNSTCDGEDDDCDGRVDETRGMCPQFDHPAGRIEGVCVAAQCMRGCADGWYIPEVVSRRCLRGCDPPEDTAPSRTHHGVVAPDLAVFRAGTGLVMVEAGSTLTLRHGAQTLPLAPAIAGATWSDPVIAGDALNIAVVATRQEPNGTRRNYGIMLSFEAQWTLATALTVFTGTNHGPAAMMWNTVTSTAQAFFTRSEGAGHRIYMGQISAGDDVDPGQWEASIFSNIPVVSGPIALSYWPPQNTTNIVVLAGLPDPQGGVPDLGMVFRRVATAVRTVIPAPVNGIVTQPAGGTVEYALIGPDNRLRWGAIAPMGPQSEPGVINGHVGPAGVITRWVSLDDGGVDAILLSGTEVAGEMHCEARYLNSFLAVEAHDEGFAGPNCNWAAHPTRPTNSVLGNGIPFVYREDTAVKSFSDLLCR